MNADQITNALLRDRYRRSFVLPRFTPRNWWECDVFELTPAGYFREFEVKISRGDFFADRKKERTVYPVPWGETPKTESKHQLLAGQDRGPVEFWYLVPEGLVKPEEVPAYAGLMIAHPSTDASLVRFSVVTPAPRRHRQKCDPVVVQDARGTCYWRMHNLLAS